MSPSRNALAGRAAAPAAGRPASSDGSRGPAIQITGLQKTFRSPSGDVRALVDTDLAVGDCEFVVVVGPSGCGKTTLLRILAGLEEASDGDVCFGTFDEGKPLRSMVFQDQGVFPWMTVQANAEFGLAARGVAKVHRRSAANAYLERLGLADFKRAYPHQLSGGMRQRVNLARAFANDPWILLMDEPLAALDEQTKMVVQADLLELWQSAQRSVVYITHSLDEAIVLGDRVVVMTQRPGRIKTIIDVPLPRPRDAYEVRNDPDFLEIRRQLWDALRSEVVKS